MRNALAGVMAVTTALALVAASFAFGAVTVESAAPAYVFAIVLCLLWAAKLIFVRPISWKHSPMHLPVLGFLIYTVVRYFTSPIEYDSRLELFRVGLYTFFYFVASQNFHRSRDRSILIAVLVILATGQSLYGFWQAATHATMVLNVERPEEYLHRAGGTYICPNHLAGLLEMILGMLLARVVIMRSGKGSLQNTALKKMLLLYFALLILGGLVATLSRGGWVATLAGFLVFLLLKGWQTRTVWPRVIVGGLMIVVIGVILWRVNAVGQYLSLTLNRYEAVPGLARDPSLGTRVAMWKGTWQMILDHAWIGTGPGTWMWFHLKYRAPDLQMRVEFAHNDYLHLLSDYGLVGGILAVAILVAFFRHASRFLGTKTSSDQRSFAMGAVVATIIILVHSLVDFNLHIPANALLLVLLMGFTVAMDDGGGRHPRVEIRQPLAIGLGLILLGVAFVTAWRGAVMFQAQRLVAQGTVAKENLYLNQAVPLLQKAQKLDPGYPDSYARLGDLYASYVSLSVREDRAALREDMLTYAIRMYRDALSLNPYDSDLMVRLANAYEKSGDPANALKTFERSLSIDPNNAATFFYLGVFHRKQGNADKAREAFSRSRELDYWSTTAPLINLEELKAVPPK